MSLVMADDAAAQREGADMNPSDLDVLLDTADVQMRYGLSDARAARRVIRDAGGRRIAGKWRVRLDVLRAWETSWTDTLSPSDVDDLSTLPLPRTSIPTELDADWWQTSPTRKGAA